MLMNSLLSFVLHLLIVVLSLITVLLSAFQKILWMLRKDIEIASELFWQKWDIDSPYFWWASYSSWRKDSLIRLESRSVMLDEATYSHRESLPYWRQKWRLDSIFAYFSYLYTNQKIGQIIRNILHGLSPNDHSNPENLRKESSYQVDIWNTCWCYNGSK